MLILSGTIVRRFSAGYYMEFCETCRAPHVHHVNDVYRKSHVYFLTYGKASFEGREVTCEICQTTRFSATKVDLPLMPGCDDRQQLLDAIPAEVQEGWAAAVEREAEIRRDPNVMSPEERLGRIADAFKGFESKAQEAIGRPLKLHPRMLLLLVLWLAICLPTWWILPVIGSLGAREGSSGADDFAIIAGILVALIAGIWLAIYYVKTVRPRYLRLHVEKPLAMELASLKPTRQEIEQVVAQLAQAKYLTALIDQTRLQAHLARSQRD